MSASQHSRPAKVATGSFGRSYNVCAGVLIVFGLYVLAHAIYDEHRGVAAPPFVPSRYTHPVENHAKHPELFRGLMLYEWASAGIFLAGGLVLRGIKKRADRCDPFSPSYAGSTALEECERVLDAELEKKHRPLRW